MSDDATIHITGAEEGQIASRVRGYFTLRGEKIRFRAIAFGRIGGHNVNIKITKKDERMIRKMGIDPEELIIRLQRKIVEGDMVIDSIPEKEG